MIPAANSRELTRKRIVIGGPRRRLLEGLREVASRTCHVLAVSSNFIVIQQAVRLLAPDIVVIDAEMGCWETRSVVNRLASASPGLRILALVPQVQAGEPGESGESAEDCLTLLPASASEELFHQTLLRMIGDDYRERVVTAVPRSYPAGGSLDILTPRQRDILRLICSAESTKGIAEILDISTRTVEFHKYRMMKALDVTTMAELIVFGITSGLGARTPQPIALREANANAERGPWEAERKNGNHNQYKFLVR
jgi:DNA-binding NarL/FixJ family response regulator